MSKIKILFFFACIIIHFLSGCSADTETIPTATMNFSDNNGISFSITVTPCTNNKNNGNILISVQNSTDDTYLYSMGFSASFQAMNGNEVNLKRLKSGSYSFRIMKKSAPETMTDIYTVYLENKGQEPPIEINAVSKAEKIIGDGEITVHTENSSILYEASIDTENWQNFSGNTAVIENLAEGMYQVTVREKSNPENISVLDVPVPHADTKRKNYIDVVPILQKPELPSGCEATSLTMLLNYMGFNVDKLTIADNYLPKGEYRKSDYNKVFVGDPRSIHAYGCTAGVIEETAEKYLRKNDSENKWQVKNITGCSVETLYSAIDNKCPVVVWASIDMGEIIHDYVTWTDEETGKKISWYGGEHCLLLTGYDMEESLVYVNDPLRGSVSYDMKIFESRFKQMNYNAVIIIPNE